ncbi:FimV/HubP family polar landmark protein [Roseateles sp. GG27B]
MDAYKRFALSHVAVAVLAAASSGAWGLGLGRLTVQSALGETLKAEIDITSLTPEEAGTLKVRIAPPDSYRATGVEYNAVLTGTQVQVTRRDGRTFLRVSSDRAVQEPFVDVILELSWASGRLVREYTLLFDPPTNPRPLGTPAPASVAAAPLISPAPLPPSAPAEAAAVPAPAAVLAQAIPPAPAAPAVAASRPRPEPRPVAAPRPPAPVPASASASANPAASAAATAGSKYSVKSGDTLYRVATKTQAAGVSLDQMLVGLYRSNPDAFVNSNMNRLKSGVVLQVPASETLTAVSPTEARQVIQAQSADFGAYRQRLAAAVPTLKPEESPQQAKGRVQTAVEDRKTVAAAPDKLTLSKAASANAEAKASKDTEKKDAAARVAELQRNVEELKKLSSAAKPAPAAPAPKAAPADVPAPAPTVVAVAVPPAPTATPASEPSPLPTTVVAVPVPVAVPAPVAAAASATMPEPPSAEPSLLDQLLGSSLLLPVGGVLLAALGALGFYRLRSRKSAAASSDTGFNESKLQPDSFFGAAGGQRVDTRDASGAASSMNYSLSQLDAIGDVDPVAEADVYLAYGRDLQAEEILKEALRANPERLAIRLKLLEVYAKRRDAKGFEQLAIQLFAETDGRGDDWERAQEMGRLIDADNPLYQPGGMPGQGGNAQGVRPETMGVIAAAPHLATEPLGRDIEDSRPMGAPISGFDLDLDLDLDAPVPVSHSSMEATQAMATSVEQMPLAMDFDLSDPAVPPSPEESNSSLAFDLDDFSLLDGEEAPPTPPADMSNALDFDLSAIDLALPDLTETPAVAEPAALQLDEFFFDLPEPATDESAEELPEVSPAAIPAAESLALEGELPDEFAQLLRDSELSESPAALGDDAAQQPDEVSANAAAEVFDPFAADDEDPLMRQLELADEFRQIGDTEGAREVLQELISKASGPVLEKAQALLSELR